jgi:sulfoxide reductase heme-binding subunit YedZ
MNSSLASQTSSANTKAAPGRRTPKNTPNMSDTQFAKLVIFINSLLPLGLVFWDLANKRVGANPLEVFTRTTGMLTLIFLTITLAITPVRKIFSFNPLIKVRRMFGLFAFFYGLLHLTTYIWFDRGLKLGSVVPDVAGRPFILVGMVGFLLMVPLAVTSTDKMLKRLGGKQWRNLHRLTYLAGVAGVVHYWMLVKSDTRIPLTFAFILFVLLGYRLLLKYLPSQPTTFASLFPRE